MYQRLLLLSSRLHNINVDTIHAFVLARTLAWQLYSIRISHFRCSSLSFAARIVRASHARSHDGLKRIRMCVCAETKSSASMSMPFRMHTSLLHKFTLFHTNQSGFRIHSPSHISSSSSSSLPSCVCGKINIRFTGVQYTHMCTYMMVLSLMAAAVAVALQSLPHLFSTHIWIRRTKATIELKQRMEHNELLHFALVYCIRSLFGRACSGVASSFFRHPFICVDAFVIILRFFLHIEIELSHRMWPMNIYAEPLCYLLWWMYWRASRMHVCVCVRQNSNLIRLLMVLRSNWIQIVCVFADLLNGFGLSSREGETRAKITGMFTVISNRPTDFVTLLTILSTYTISKHTYPVNMGSLPMQTTISIAKILKRITDTVSTFAWGIRKKWW